MSILKEFISKLDKLPTIGVVGDAMLDQYYDVQVKKISPEFPIPVMQGKDDSEDFPGGAANVAYQLKNFPAKVQLLAFTDSNADWVFRCHGLDVSLSQQLNRNIPRKKRFYSDGFPTYRWDVESPLYGLKPQDVTQHCYELYQGAIKQKFDALIFSDYDKGVFSQYLEMLIPETPISVVDPKGKNIDKWRGCTVFKPNAAEALALSGRNNLWDAGLALRDRLHCKVVITNGGDGVIVVGLGVEEIKPRTKVDPQSVIGAGDCFVAFLTLALTQGMELRDAAEVALEACQIYVKNRKNKPLFPRDLVAVYNSSLAKICETPPDLTGKVVFTNGVFDILHCGHIETLKFAKSKGDILVVGVNTDESVASLKPGRPYVKLADRMNLLASLEFVDIVIPFGEKTPRDLIRKLSPDVLVKGGNYWVEDIVGSDLVKEVYVAPLVEGLSTTNLVEKIKARD